jgi:hypothetical protein
MVFGPLTWTMGLATAATGAHDEAITHLERTLVVLVEHDLVAFIPTLRLQLAQVLRRRGAAGDGERAASLLTTARDEAVAIGAGGIVERIDAVAETQ